MRTSGSVDHSRRARLTGAASRGSIWKTAGVSTAATYTNSHPTRTRRMSMAPVCSCDVSAVLYACVRCQAFENSLSAGMLAGRRELLAGGTVQGMTTPLVAARAWERCSWPERRTCGVWPEAEQAGGPGCCATAITRFTKVPPAPLSEYQFRHPEIIAVDPALMVDPGNHSCHSTPRKPDPPRHWDQ